MNSQIWVILLCLGTVLVEADDSLCHARQGSCHDDHLPCSGSYVSGLCAGAVSRRCCVPHSSGSGCGNVNIVSRSQWGARSARSTSYLHLPVELMFIHHTETPECHDESACAARVRSIQSYHMDHNGWGDIGYSFLVGEDGKVYEGRGWDRVGAHTYGYNSRGVAISFIGSYMSKTPGSAAITAAKNLIACGVSLGKLTSSYRLYGHRDAGSTNCPGDALYNLIRTWPHYSTVHPIR